MSRFGLGPLLGVAMLFAGSLAAQEPKPPAMNAKMQDLLNRFDKNGDGKIDDDERADAQEVMMKERIEKQVTQSRSLAGADGLAGRLLELFDKNRDGRLDEEERNSALKLVDATATGGVATEARSELMRRFDKNGDATLSPEERGAFLAFLAEIRPAPNLAAFSPPGGEKRPEVAGAMKETEKVIRAALESDAAQRTRFDKNKDGKIDDEEWNVARREIGLALTGMLGSVVSNPTPEQEQKRLEAVAAEVARRREQREIAQGLMVGGKAISALSPEDIEKLRQKPRESLSPEEIRALAVADEVARRRKLREQAGMTEAAPKK